MIFYNCRRQQYIVMLHPNPINQRLKQNKIISFCMHYWIIKSYIAATGLMIKNQRQLMFEFKSKLKRIASLVPHPFVTRQQDFIKLLASNSIKIYSKQQMVRLHKFFDNPSKTCRINIPLSYLSLDCVQQCQENRYFIVRISPVKVNIELTEIYRPTSISKEKQHQVGFCVEHFIKIMRRLYGSQKNWFKVLGGLTVAITIEPSAFRRSLQKILHNTNHRECAQKITKYFLKESSVHKIEWKGFMKIINAFKSTHSIINQQKFNITNVTYHSVQLSKLIFMKESQHEQMLQSIQSKRKSSLQSRQERLIQSAHNRQSQSRRQQSKFTVSAEFINDKEQCPRYFSISAKPCVLYQKKHEMRLPIRPVPLCNSFKTRSTVGHRKAKTETSFFQSDKIISINMKQSTAVKTESIEIAVNQLLVLRSQKTEGSQMLTTVGINVGVYTYEDQELGHKIQQTK